MQNKKLIETRISLVGWDTDQVILHTRGSFTGVAFYENWELKAFGETPWLQGKIAVIRPRQAYNYNATSTQRRPAAEFRRNALKLAYDAILHKDMEKLAEAITTTFVAQCMMGAEILPNMGEMAKRYVGNFSVYLFAEPSTVNKETCTSYVLTV